MELQSRASTLQSLQTSSDQANRTQIQVYSDLYVETARTAVSHITNAFKAELTTLTSTELSKMRQYKESVTFDPSTAWWKPCGVRLWKTFEAS
ncbi:hypothetical protein OJAV_G00179440 [Oryzias javanicus]|uniref:Uncharacterized protein n=1 Tax=Oryzias javanicus TaxID=123683 RepID=A0A3S2PG71_ORYJA|nr:hypothetical protein OJAV_G00179440 [Oryzias javanicus]